MKFRFDSISKGAVEWIAGKAYVKIWPEGEKLDYDPISLYGLEPDVYTVVIEES